MKRIKSKMGVIHFTVAIIYLFSMFITSCLCHPVFDKYNYMVAIPTPASCSGIVLPKNPNGDITFVVTYELSHGFWFKRFSNVDKGTHTYTVKTKEDENVKEVVKGTYAVSSEGYVGFTYTKTSFHITYPIERFINNGFQILYIGQKAFTKKKEEVDKVPKRTVSGMIMYRKKCFAMLAPLVLKSSADREKSAPLFNKHYMELKPCGKDIE